MQARLLARETGDLAAPDFARAVAADLLPSFAPAPQHRFDGEPAPAPAARPARAHAAGASSLALDHVHGRLLVSGGADGAIKVWDLEQSRGPHAPHTFGPVAAVARAPPARGGPGHSRGVTHLAFYPFDADAFLSSSYDKTLRLWSSRRAALSAAFDLNATVYAHAMSPLAGGRLLVACATQHSHVRLVDLASGAAVQALVAHGGPVLCAAWSPRHEHVLASGHADGRVRIWDTRRAAAAVAQLDPDDSVGVVGGSRRAADAAAPAHDEAVNGVGWTDDGRYLLTAGLDRRIRVWDADTGANTLASFGALVQNQHATTARFALTPSALRPARELLFWANDYDILVLDLLDGTLVTRLRSPGPRAATAAGVGAGAGRITALAWRGSGGGAGRPTGPVMGGGNAVGAVYSAHLDGQIRAWMPRMPGPDAADEDEEPDEDEQARKRKRRAVDDAYRSLMGRRVTYI